MAIVSRLALNHPALSAVGGASLHASVEALYVKLGDAVATRWYQLTDFDQGETVDLEHDFDTDLENLRWDLYVYTGGQWVLVTTASTPARSDFSVVEKAGFEDITLQITNATGGNDLLAAVVLANDPLHLRNGDVKDVLITSPANGDGLVYDSGTGKFVNQPSTAVAKGYTKFVGSGEAYATLRLAIAAAVVGDWILVRTTTTETAGDLSLGVADVRVECSPGALVNLSGALTNGLRLTAARVQLENFALGLAPSGAQARGVSIEAADCTVSGRVDYTTAQALTDAVHITSGGLRAGVAVGVNRTAGTITNLLTNNDGAGDPSVWGG